MNWQAEWIWSDEAEISPRNRWQCFRHTFKLDKNWNRSRLAITADSRYVLFVNGELVGRGPARSWPFAQTYDVHEVGHLLKRDELNTIAVIVLHFGLSTFSYVRGRGGLLLQLDLLDSYNAAIQTVATDAQWKTQKHPGYNERSQRISCQQGFTESFDSNQLPEDWILPIYNDSHWPDAKVIGPVGTEPWTNLVERDIALLTEEPFWPVRVQSLANVQPVSWTATIDMRSAMLPDSANHANVVGFNGYLATVIRVEENVKATIGFPETIIKFGPLILNGQTYYFDYANQKLPEQYFEVELKAGDTLFLLDVSSDYYHGHSLHLAIDCPIDFQLTSPLGTNSVANSAFVTLGPFEPFKKVDHEAQPVIIDPIAEKAYAQIADCATAEALLEFIAWMQPLPKTLISEDSVFSRFVWNSSRENQPMPPSLQNLVIANAEAGEVPIFRIDEIAKNVGDSEFVVDFGREYSGYLSFEIEAEAGTVLDFYGLEYLKDDWRQHTYGLDNTLRYICKEGRQRYVSLVRRGLRYLVVAVRYSKSPRVKRPLKFYGLQLRQSNYSVAEIGSFKCADELLNSIWQISQHTTRLCMEDTFVDCPAYEQTFWVGDARNEALINYYLFGASDIVRHCLKLVPGSKFHSPLYADQVPSGWNSVIPNWTLLWVLACHEYYLQTGDREFAAEISPHICFTLDHYLQKIDANGLLNITAWNLLDWAKLDQPGSGVVTHQNMLLVKTLRISAILAEIAQDTAHSAHYQQAADALKRAINTQLWSEEAQAYRDAIHSDGKLSNVFSMQVQALALLCQVTEGERANRLERYLQNPPSNFVQIGSPFMAFFYYEALAQKNLFAEMVADMRLHYGEMIEDGATTCWETYSDFFDKPTDPRYLTRSHCHAWSAAPAYFLPAYILGVRSLEPSWKKVVIAPQPVESITWARGSVPLPNGDSIKVAWRVKPNSKTLWVEVTAPSVLDIVFEIPEGYTPIITRQ